MSKENVLEFQVLRMKLDFGNIFLVLLGPLCLEFLGFVLLKLRLRGSEIYFDSIVVFLLPLGLTICFQFIKFVAELYKIFLVSTSV